MRPYKSFRENSSAPPVLEHRGYVKFFLENEGWGFITPANSGNDIFFHQSAVVDGRIPQRHAEVVYAAGVSNGGRFGATAVKVL
jgi:cold shock CspA family protein